MLFGLRFTLPERVILYEDQEDAQELEATHGRPRRIRTMARAASMEKGVVETRSHGPKQHGTCLAQGCTCQVGIPRTSRGAAIDQ